MSTRAPFLIAVALGDGTEAEIPAASHAELERLLGRMADACARNRCPFPAVAISEAGRRARGALEPETGTSPAS